MLFHAISSCFFCRMSRSAGPPPVLLFRPSPSGLPLHPRLPLFHDPRRWRRWVSQPGKRHHGTSRAARCTRCPDSSWATQTSDRGGRIRDSPKNWWSFRFSVRIVRLDGKPALKETIQRTDLEPSRSEKNGTNKTNRNHDPSFV